MAEETKPKTIVEEQFGHYTAFTEENAKLVETEFKAQGALRTTIQPEGDRWIVSAFKAKKN